MVTAESQRASVYPYSTYSRKKWNALREEKVGGQEVSKNRHKVPHT
jgi:hypothetical protein